MVEAAKVGENRVGFSPTGAKLARKDGKAMTDGIGTHSIGSIIYKKLPADIVRFKCTSGFKYRSWGQGPFRQPTR